jgi:hypothetical protein
MLFNIFTSNFYLCRGRKTGNELVTIYWLLMVEKWLLLTLYKRKKPFQINDLEWFVLLLTETVVSFRDPGGVRTLDPQIKSLLLYQLSY